MDRTHSRPRRQPPSLTVRTKHPAKPPSVLQTPSLSSQQSYPIAIPGDKLEKALDLFDKYCKATLKERLENEHSPSVGFNGESYLGVPGPLSQPSSRHRRADSVSTSFYDGITDISSVLSFDGNPSPSSTTAGQGESMISFDGKKVKTRTRKKLGPKARAKAALVRHLGSCPRCRSRRVQCPLNHHDVENLERLRNERQQTRPRVHHQHKFSSSGSSGHTTTTPMTGWPQSVSGASPTDFLGIGDNLQYVETPTPTIMFSDPEILGPSLYKDHQDGQMFALGVQRGAYFSCQNMDGCNVFCNSADELQLHFEETHFAFTRIDPAHRYVCSACLTPNFDFGQCEQCLKQGYIELWIYGHYIRPQTSQRHAPDGLDTQNYAYRTNIPFSSAISQNAVSPFEPDTGNRNLNNYTNTGSYNAQGGNAYGDHGSQGYEQNLPAGPEHDGLYRGSAFGGAWHVGLQIIHKSIMSVKLMTVKTQQVSRWNRHFLLLLLMLPTAIASGLTYEWIFSNAHSIMFKAATELGTKPAMLGYIGTIASLGLGISIKYLAGRCPRRMQCAPRPCPLQAHLSQLSVLGSRQTAPRTYLDGGRWPRQRTVFPRRHELRVSTRRRGRQRL